MPKLHCPACSSEKLSDETDYASFDSHARFRDWEQGVLSWKDLTVSAERARICLACGFMMLFAGPTDLEKLRKPTDLRSARARGRADRPRSVRPSTAKTRGSTRWKWDQPREIGTAAR